MRPRRPFEPVRERRAPDDFATHVQLGSSTRRTVLGVISDSSSVPLAPAVCFFFLCGSGMATKMAKAKKREAITPTHAASHSLPVAEMTTPPSSPPLEPPRRKKVIMIGCFWPNSAGEDAESATYANMTLFVPEKSPLTNMAPRK